MQTKSEILSNLYSLRASLSEMSILKDEMDSVDREVAKIKRENELQKQSLISKIQNKQEIIEKSEKDLSSKKLTVKEKNVCFILASIGMLLLSAVCVGLTYLLWMLTKTVAHHAYIMWVTDLDWEFVNQWVDTLYAFTSPMILLLVALLTLAVGVAVFACIGGSIYFIVRSISKKKETAEARNMISSLERKTKGIKDDIEKYEKEIIENDEDTMCMIVEELENKDPIKQSFALASCMTEYIFQNFLDVRDWSYIDLIIYYFETGRADTLKEALQLVDNEKRNEVLVKAISTACEELSKVIYDGFYQLRKDIDNGIKLLATKIEDLTEEQRYNNQVLSDKLSVLTSSVNLNNALQAKIAVNSTQLVKDMYYMRENSKQEIQNSSYIKAMLKLNAETICNKKPKET